MAQPALCSWPGVVGAERLQALLVTTAACLSACLPRAPGDPGIVGPNPWCGNGIQEEGEVCDGADLGGLTCHDTVGKEHGTLSCTVSCEVDTSGCNTCGDGAVEGPEECEADRLGVRSCQELGHNEGAPYCDAGCRLAGCFTCGDGVCALEEGETALRCPADCGGWRDLALGGRHGCAVTQAGRVYCWGDNLHGQCGSGGRALPALEEGLFAVSGLNDMERVSSGWAHSCAVRGDGQLFCWGSNLAGQLGLGAQALGQEIRLVPAVVPGLGRITEAAAGADHTCALREDGAVFCFGRNLFGQLGDGTSEDRAAPMRVWGLPPARAVVAGHSFTCAVTEDGRVWCWGLNDAGQLGCGALLGLDARDGYVYSTWPVPVLGLAAVGHLGLGLASACAVEERTDGEHQVGVLFCWGANDAGQLGDGRPHQLCGVEDCSPAPVEVPLPYQAKRVDVGGRHACVSLADGAVWCWGDPSRGRLGRADLAATAQSCPAGGCLPAPLAGAAATGPRLLALGMEHGCAVAADKSLLCWGANEAGQVGCGSYDCITPYALVDRIVR